MDDTADIQLALTACSSSTYGGIVYFPPGLYIVSESLNVGFNTRVVGAGYGVTTIAPSQTTTSVFIVAAKPAPPSLTATNVYFEDFAVTPTNKMTLPAGGPPPGVIAAISGGRGLHCNRLAISGPYYDGIQINGDWLGVWIEQCDFAAASSCNDSIAIGTISAEQNADVWITDCAIGGSTLNHSGIHYQSMNGFFILDCDLNGNGYGLLIDPPAGQTVYNGFVTGCAFDLSGGSGIYISPANATSAGVYQIYFVNSWSCGAQGNGIQMNPLGHVSAFVDTISFEATRINTNGSLNGGYGLVIGGSCTNIKITDCDILATKSGSGGPGTGIVIVGSGNSDIVIANNRIGNAPASGTFYTGQQYALSVGVAVSNLAIAGNDFGSATAPVTANANAVFSALTTGASVRIKNNLGYIRGWIQQVTVSTGTFIVQNTSGFDSIYAISGGTVSSIGIGSSSGSIVTTGLTSGAFPVQAGAYIQVSSTVAPTCQQFAADS